MSLTVDGRAALIAMARAPERFNRLRERDWSSAAVKFARKQLTAAGQTREDLIEIRDLLGDDIFQKSLDALSAMHAKQLARRIDPAVDADEIKTGAMALMHIRKVLGDDWHGDTAPAASSKAQQEAPAEPSPKPANPYIGRKAFRTGR